MQLVWGPHLEDHWQKEMLLGINWGRAMACLCLLGVISCVEGDTGIYLL